MTKIHTLLLLALPLLLDLAHGARVTADLEEESASSEAASKEGVGAGEEGVTFEGTGNGPGFAVEVVRSSQKPDKPVFRDVTEVGDDLLLQVELRDNGVEIHPGFAVSLRRQFLQENTDVCNLVPLQPCGSGLADKEPCFYDAPASAGPGIVLRNLAFASRYEVQVAVQNADGWSDAMQVFVLTRAKSGLPLKNCAVAWWACSPGGPQGPKDHLPRASDPECSLTAQPLPVCFHTWPLGETSKCKGQKYMQRCLPVLQAGSVTCAGELHNVCSYKPGKEIKPAPAKCAAAGCPTSSWLSFSKERCCCKSKEDTAEDSPNCACTTEDCSELGMVDAANPSSCRH